MRQLLLVNKIYFKKLFLLFLEVKQLGAGIAGASLVGGMLTKKAQEDVEALRQSGDRGLLQGYLRRYYGNLNPNASAEEIEEFVRTNSAEGGRIGYAMR